MLIQNKVFICYNNNLINNRPYPFVIQSAINKNLILDLRSFKLKSIFITVHYMLSFRSPLRAQGKPTTNNHLCVFTDYTSCLASLVFSLSWICKLILKGQTCSSNCKTGHIRIIGANWISFAVVPKLSHWLCPTSNIRDIYQTTINLLLLY